MQYVAIPELYATSCHLTWKVTLFAVATDRVARLQQYATFHVQHFRCCIQRRQRIPQMHESNVLTSGTQTRSMYFSCCLLTVAKSVDRASVACASLPVAVKYSALYTASWSTSAVTCTVKQSASEPPRHFGVPRCFAHHCTPLSCWAPTTA